MKIADGSQDILVVRIYTDAGLVGIGKRSCRDIEFVADRVTRRRR